MKEFSRKIEEALPLPGRRTAERDESSERRTRSHYQHPMVALKAAHAADRNLVERFADTLIRIASSTPLLLLHLGWFGIWVLWNTGVIGWRPFDPFPFGLLTMIVSLEAIFLSIFVLIGQKREAAIAELREELTLQVNLRMEAEVTKTLQLVAGLYTRLGYQVADDEELREMLKALNPEAIEQELKQQIENAGRKGKTNARTRDGAKTGA